MIFGPLSLLLLKGVPISGNSSQSLSLLEPSPSAVSESVMNEGFLVYCIVSSQSVGLSPSVLVYCIVSSQFVGLSLLYRQLAVCRSQSFSVGIGPGK
jgi:hypothetical protein